LLRHLARLIFSVFAPDFDQVADYSPIPESDIREYHRSVERPDQVLANIEKNILRLLL
jgi:hypothetical protein